MITCNGFAGQVDFDPDAEVFGGTVVNANVLMSFEGKTVAERRKSLRDVVDAYLADCTAAGKQHEKPYNGTIIIRVDPEIHRRLAMKAAGRSCLHPCPLFPIERRALLIRATSTGRCISARKQGTASTVLFGRDGWHSSAPRWHLPMRDQSPPYQSVRDAQGARRAVRRTEAKRSPQQPDPPESCRGRRVAGATSLPSGRARPTAYTAPITRSTDKGSIR
ncbi:MAG: type II toxin-antitoxin system HicB family antitoxin [Spirochaetes bacterium]|nr:type II toxin-antitoxin system HicB family antitoxin [Spirochaetota bacterium]